MKAQEKQAEYLVIPNIDSTASKKAARLGDVTESMKNGLYKPAGEYGDDGVPCLRMYNIDAGKIAWRDIKRMRVSASELKDYGLIEGDLLVNRVNSRELVGKSALIPPGMGPSVFESKNIRLRLKTDRALPKFINYQLLAFGRQHFSNNAQQVVGMASVSQKQLAGFPIVLASLDQQKRIVAEIEKQFSRLDEAVANLKRVKANLKRYKAAVLKAAVEGRLVETEAERARREGRSFETGAQLLQRILEIRRSQWQGKGKYKEPAAPDTTELPELPDGWAWATADQLMSLITDGEHVTPQRSETGVLLLSARNVLNGRLDLTEVDYVPEEEHVRISRRLSIRTGDVLLSCSGSVGRTCVVPDGVRFSLVRSVAVLRPVLIPAAFVSYQIQSAWLQAQIAGKKTQTAQANIFQGKIRQLIFALPPEHEQESIVAEIDASISLADNAEAQVDANLKRASSLRQAILAESFNPRYGSKSAPPNTGEPIMQTRGAS